MPNEASENYSIGKRILTLLLGIAVIILVFALFTAINYYINRPEKILETPQIEPQIYKEDIETIINRPQEDLKKFNEFKKVDIYPNSLITPTNLLSSCKFKSKDRDKCNEEIAKITKVLICSGKINNAYLYIKAAVSENDEPLGPLKDNNSIWLYFDDSGYGGHLLKSAAIINRQSEEGFTELLYNLNSITFTNLPYNENNSSSTKNILDDKLNQGGDHLIGAFVSTLGYGKIIELKIGYEGGEIKLK